MEKMEIKMQELKKQLYSKNINVIENAPMSQYTSFKAGGEAKMLVIVETVEELKEVLQTVADSQIKSMMLGNGSNTLFKDSGYDGVVIKLGDGFAEVSVNEETATVEAGASILLSVLAKQILAASLAGFEFASGIPGSLGGALFMNAGAYGGEMKDIVQYVRAVSTDGKEERVFTAEEMEFAYRHSALEENHYIAVSAVMQLKKGDKDAIAAEMKELMEKRNSKQPVAYPSAGSTFKRPEGYFAGKLIQDAGLKGVSVGGAEVSTLHSGFIINKGGATATDIINLIHLVQNTVYDKYGVKLEPEVRIIG